MNKGKKLAPRSRGMGAKAWAKHLRREGGPTIKIKNPDRYLNAHARRRVALQEAKP
jgi:hypothetical protein